MLNKTLSYHQDAGKQAVTHHKGTSNNPIKNKNQWVQKKQEPLNQEKC